ncbi:MAG: ion transporter [Planctomycetota bacterium]
MTARTSVHALLEREPATGPATLVRLAIATLIAANIVAIVFETVPAVRDAGGPAFGVLETVSVAVFAIEYLLRGWAAPEQARYAGPTGRLRWAVSAPALIDLAAILPSLLALAGFDLRVLRLLRLSRLVRIAKLSRYSLAVQTLARVLKAKAPDLLSLLFLLVVLLVVSSTLMFHLENEAQPKGFSSIPATMWWGIVTLTTIGYGDLTPVTAAGKVLGGLIAILGIGMFALPAGLLGAAFVDELGKARSAKTGSANGGDRADAAASTCPHCGRALGP